MSKKIYMCLILKIIVVAIFSVVCFADSNKYVFLKSEKPNAENEIVVHFSIHDLEEGILGLQGTLNYDHENLELVDIKINDDNWIISAFNKDNGKFIAEIGDEGFFNTDMHIKDKDNFIDFKFKDLKKSNNYKLELTDIKLGNMQETIEVEPIQIKIKSTINIFAVIVIIIILIIVCIILKNKRKKV